MKNIAATSRFRIFIALAMIMFCGFALFLMEPIMNESKFEKLRIEKAGRLTVFKFYVKVVGMTKPISVRAVVSRETKFRVAYKITENFPHIETKQLEAEKVLWVTEHTPPGKKYLTDSWAGLFLAFDGDFGHIQSLLHAHRVYRKHLNEFEIDYVFSADDVTREELTKHIHEIDKQVFAVLKNHEAFSK